MAFIINNIKTIWGKFSKIKILKENNNFGKILKQTKIVPI